MGETHSLSPAQPAASVPASVVLENWLAHSWCDGVHIPNLTAFDRLTFCTRNSVYEIVVLAPVSGEVFIKGGTFFPTFTRVHLAGCSLGGSFLKLYSVHPGFCVELVPEHGGIILTTRVRSVAVAAADRQSVN